MIFKRKYSIVGDCKRPVPFWWETILKFVLPSFVQTITYYENGITIISADNPVPYKRRTKIKIIGKEEWRHLLNK